MLGLSSSLNLLCAVTVRVAAHTGSDRVKPIAAMHGGTLREYAISRTDPGAGWKNIKSNQIKSSPPKLDNFKAIQLVKVISINRVFIIQALR
jgi:hypothetical protein